LAGRLRLSKAITLKRGTAPEALALHQKGLHFCAETRQAGGPQGPEGGKAGSKAAYTNWDIFSFAQLGR